MHYRFILFVLVLIAFTSFNSCKSSHTTTNSGNENQETVSIKKAGPPVIVYKTTGKYFNKVPVGLSPDKTKIVNYPGPTDLFYKGAYAYPTMLENGYLLDNRGIDENSAFLEYSYEEYNKLEPMSSEELFEHILDNDPFTEMYYCGSRFDFRDIEKELNDLIAGGNLASMKKLK